MNGPPVKTKRAGDLAATSPNCFELADRTPIVYVEQAEWHREADRLLSEFERTGDMRHFVALSRHLVAMRERGVAP